MKFRLMSAVILFAMILFIPAIAQAKIVSVEASTHVLALDDNGTVWAWGENMYGQLGIGVAGVQGQYSGITAPRNPGGWTGVSVPQKVLIDNVTAIAVNLGDSFALKKDGTVWAWGYGEDGRLGYGGYQNQPQPVQVEGLTDIVSIAAGGQNCYALKSDGTVWAWGDNRDGEIGDGNYGSPRFRSTPVQAKGLTGIEALGERGNYAIKDDGTVLAWGNNNGPIDSDGTILSYGTLGDTLRPGIRPEPFQVEGVTNVSKITFDDGSCYTIYVKDDGTVWAWGLNNQGAFGNGMIKSTSEPDEWSPIMTPPSVQTKIANVTDISTMNGHSVALKDDGTVWFWGSYIDRKASYDIDNSGMPATDVLGIAWPVQVNGLDHVVDVSAGFIDCFAVKDDGSVWGWGRNEYKQLGNYKKAVAPSPVMIIGAPVQATPNGTSLLGSPVNTSPASTASISNTASNTMPGPSPSRDTELGIMALIIGTPALIGGCIAYLRMR